jgi:hypothetical protein
LLFTFSYFRFSGNATIGAAAKFFSNPSTVGSPETPAPSPVVKVWTDPSYSAGTAALLLSHKFA